MRRRWLVVSLTTLLVLGSTRLSADYAADYWLALINAALEEVAKVKMALEDALQGNILGIYSSVFPGAGPLSGVFEDMSLVAQELTTVRSDVRRLSCDWSFTARTVSLRDSLLSPIHFCKPSFQVTWGEGSGWEEDMDELHDAVASMGLNVLSSRAQVEDVSWAAIWPSLQGGVEHVRRSPGEANRDEAVALAGADLMAQQDANVKALQTLVESDDDDLERLTERKEADFQAYLLAFLAEASPSPANPGMEN